MDPPPPSATTPPRVAGAWMKMHEGFLEGSRGHTEVLFLGDSITQGWGGHGRADLGSLLCPATRPDFGIGGDRTQHVLWRLDNGELDGIKPKVVVLMIGTNNIRAELPRRDRRRASRRSSRGSARSFPKTKILLLGVFPRSEQPDATRERSRAVNESIAKLDDGKIEQYLDIGNSFLNDDGTISQEIMPDYLHLSPKGYRIWADAMEPTLWESMEGK